MRRTEMLQEIRKMRFEEAYEGWTESRLPQDEAARRLGVFFSASFHFVILIFLRRNDVKLLGCSKQ
jgi:hypothetical protein